MSVDFDTIEYSFVGALKKQYSEYKYKHIDHDIESVEDFISVPGPKKFFLVQTYKNVPYEVQININFCINYTDVKEKVYLIYGVDKQKKIIYWKYDRSEYY